MFWNDIAETRFKHVEMAELTTAASGHEDRWDALEAIANSLDEKLAFMLAMGRQMGRLEPTYFEHIAELLYIQRLIRDDLFEGMAQHA